MTCPEFHEMCAAYALGALDPEEQRLCELHLAASEHEKCREKLVEARRAVHALGESIPAVRPRDAVWKGLESRLDLTSARVPAARGGRGARAAALLFAVAAAAAVVFALRERKQVADLQSRLGGSDTRVTGLVAERDQCARDLNAAKGQIELHEQAIALLERPGTQVLAFAPQGEAKSGGSVVVNFKDRKAVAIARGLTPQDQKDYELWVIRGDKKEPAGVFHGDPGTTLIPVPPALLAEPADALAITLEPAGGGPVPRGDLVLVGAVPKG